MTHIDCRARNYTSEEEMRASYAAVKRRLVDARPKRAAPAQTTIPVASIRSQEPQNLTPCTPAELCVKLGLDWYVYHDRSRGEERFTMASIKRAACAVYEVGIGEICSTNREARILEPRNVIVAVARRLTDLSTPQIGSALGGRDHTTILNAIRKTQAAINRVAALVPFDATPIDWVRAMRDHLAKK